MKRVAALPAESLHRVVGRPDVKGRKRIDDARVVGRPVVGHLGPGADPDAVGLRDAAVLQERPGRGLVIGPDALLERAAKLGVVGLADEVVPLMVEGGVEEELVVLQLESLFSSRIPPFRMVISCSHSASARTVTAHSLKAIGM